METLNASDVKLRFGEVLIKAQQAPVGINKNRKPVAVMVSATEYAEMELLRERFLQEEIAKGVADIKAGRLRDGQEVLDSLRKQVRDAGV